MSIVVGKFTIAFYLDWSDQSEGQLTQIADFLRKRSFRIGETHRLSKSKAFGLRIGEQKAVIGVAVNLVKSCFKKRAELVTVLEYRKLDLITGSEVQKRFEHSVRIGMRERHGSRAFKPMPWAFSVGYRLSKKSVALRSPQLRQKLSEAQKSELRSRHKVFGESLKTLSEAYGISRSAVWRLLNSERKSRLSS